MNTPGRSRAAIYCRVSTRGQEAEGTSLASQEEHCRRYAAEHGHAVAEQQVYREVHTGAELWERPQLTRLREAVRRHEVHAVIIYALDRLSRKQAHVAIIAEECERAGVALLFVTERFEQSAVGEFIRSAKAFAAELEREKIRERAMRGMDARVKGGKLLPGPRPLYGYRWSEDKGAYIIDEATAPIVRRIFAEVKAGTPLRQLALDLTREGVPTPSGTAVWWHTTLRNILNHPRYTGVAIGNQYRWEKLPGNKRGPRVERPIADHVTLPAGTVPPLVTEEDAAAVRAILQQNKRLAARGNHNPEAFLLRGGFVRCGYCGNGARTDWHRTGGKSGILFPHYRVSRRLGEHEGCPRVNVSAAMLDRAVWSKVEAILLDPAIIAAEVAKLREADPVAADLDAIDAALATVARKQGNLARKLALFDDDEAAAPLVGEIAALGKQRRQLEEERGALLAQRRGWRVAQDQLQGLEDWCQTVAANLEELTYEVKRQVLTMLGVSVKVYEREHAPRWEITASIPLNGEATARTVDTSACVSPPPTSRRPPPAPSNSRLSPSPPPITVRRGRAGGRSRRGKGSRRPATTTAVRQQRASARR